LSPDRNAPRSAIDAIMQRMTRTSRNLAATALLAWAAVGHAAEPPTPAGPSLVGLDHVPTVVADLDQASEDYRRIGFSLKPGRAHDDGLRNRHVKFRDGSGIELIAVPEAPTDAITRAYSERLRQGEGPVYLSLHARETDALVAALDAAHIRFEQHDGLTTLADPRLAFLFFVQDNRSPTDLPVHFAHPNGAVAMTEVWLALDVAALESLRNLLVSLGAVEHTGTAEVPEKTAAHVFELQSGRVVVVPADRQRIAGREIIGARFSVPARRGRAGCRGDAVVQPALAHGLTLCFPGR
jgi:hypothetical protein